MSRFEQENSQDKAYKYVKDRILNLTAKPGAPLRAQEIARSLDISRTPVREALSRLEQEGFVIRQDGWGYIVRPMPPQDILSLFTIREFLEVQVALEAIPKLTRETLNKLHQILQTCAELLKQKRYTPFRLKSREFHLSIAEISENELLYRLLKTVRDRTLLVSALHQDMHPSRAKAVLAENINILKALRSGTDEVVKAAVIHHIRSSRESLLPETAIFQDRQIAKQTSKKVIRRNPATTFSMKSSKSR
jgi:DNA-binding GntR family transcriptional regulator